ncbi:response regulator transcription factor [Paenibacillus sp. strain BS8-2]
MYNILIVDDEPLICEGLTQLISASGIAVNALFNANSGYEALDYLRMEDIDLLVTDIQMGSMNGIELMQQAKIIKPWVQVIIISAHETFQYAQLAIRFGAKDYLIKPLNSEQFLSSVRHVLLHMDKSARDSEQLLSELSESFHMREPLPVRMALLKSLLEPKSADRTSILTELSRQHGVELSGPYYAMIKVRLDLESGDRAFTRNDVELLQYAALNIAGELLGHEWDYQSLYDPDGSVCILIQWDEVKYGDSSVDKVNQLEMIGRSLHFNIGKFLELGSVVGISQILMGASFLGAINEQASKAMLWSRQFKDHHVFYYGDFKWGVYSDAEPTEDEVVAQNNLIVERSTQYIHQNYSQKGLTLNEVALKNHVSPNYLSYLFKKKTGCNLWEYVIKLRMEESKRLILHTDLRRYEISELVGYESPEHFSKIFKKYFGMSPSEMKK